MKLTKKHIGCTIELSNQLNQVMRGNIVDIKRNMAIIKNVWVLGDTSQNNGSYEMIYDPKNEWFNTVYITPY